MKYTIPLVLDSKNEPTGLFSLHTTTGKIVFIFTNPIKTSKFANLASNMLATEGQKFGTVQMEASAFNEIVRQLWNWDPTLTGGNVNFLPDSDPLFDEIITQMG